MLRVQFKQAASYVARIIVFWKIDAPEFGDASLEWRSLFQKTRLTKIYKWEFGKTLLIRSYHLITDV